MTQAIFKMASIKTPLGSMVAIADEKALYLLEFADRRTLKRKLERLQARTKALIVSGITKPLQSIEEELQAYFARTLQNFQTPLFLLGSDFQKYAWQTLLQIPYGETRSYMEQANALQKPSACRAVANANGANQLAIIIPCHRIINSNGQLGGYGGGIERKKWLLHHEKQTLANPISSATISKGINEQSSCFL